MVAERTAPAELHHLPAFKWAAIAGACITGVCIFSLFVFLGAYGFPSRFTPVIAELYFLLSLGSLFFGLITLGLILFWATSGYVVTSGTVEWRAGGRYSRTVLFEAVVDIRETPSGVYLTSLLGNRIWIPKNLPGFASILEQACLHMDRNAETIATWAVRRSWEG